MSLLLDVLILALFSLYVISGFKKGLTRSIVSFLGMIVALSVSLYLSNVIAEAVYNNYIQARLITEINAVLDEYVGQSIDYKAKAVLDELPSVLSNGLMFFGVTSDTVEDVIQNSTDNASYSIVKLFAPIIINIIKSISMPIIFFVVMIPIKFVSKTVSRIVRIPVLKQADQILGSVVGALRCILVLVIITFLLKMFLPMMDSNIQHIFSKNTIESTVLFRIFYFQNPIYDFLISGIKYKINV